MYRLSSIVILLFSFFQLAAQSPHGTELSIDCAKCHTADSWEMSAEHFQFDHDSTRFELQGQHIFVDCKSCHSTLVFNEAKNECASCHLDLHQQTVGSDCIRCHDTRSWIVNTIPEIHEQISFPLMGSHQSEDCYACHDSESGMQFPSINTDCISCHDADYKSSSNPSHEEAGYSLDCSQCHGIFMGGWGSDNFEHGFFPLEEGHDISDCKTCHINNQYEGLSTDCVSCHQEDFDQSMEPNHSIAAFTTDCASCHTTSQDWTPAKFEAHDVEHFPIYSGAHSGEWNACLDCHQDQSDYTIFTCISCHTNPDTDDEHLETEGYIYNDQACLACHPDGTEEGVFDHSTTDFQLTNAHEGVDCLSCHENGFKGTSTVCVDCHQIDFDQSTNPNHGDLGIPTDCALCHSTEPDWVPADFPIHEDYFILSGSHTTVNCIDCHMGDYINTPNNCVGCHQTDYDESSNPNHTTLGFPLDCASCHTFDPDWTPAAYVDHDNNYPLTGVHASLSCDDCHIGNYINTPNTCVGCHQEDFDQTSNPDHTVLGFPTDCASCHSTDPDWTPADYVEHNDFYPLDGAHAFVSCNDCHMGNYTNTPNTCVACHQTDYDQTSDPDHTDLGFPTDCASCHTTDPGWMPADFLEHDIFYPLTGAHITVNCNDCHIGSYVDAPNTCVGCHQTDYDESINPDHSNLALSTDCLNCHTTNPDWIPADFPDHDSYFALSGAHIPIASACVLCHDGDYINTPNTCVGCHQTDYNESLNPDHNAIGIPTDCAMCHTTDPNWIPADFPIHDDYYVLTGAHVPIADQCALCHNGDYTNTPNTCAGCHISEYNQTINPDHASIGIPTNCDNCHTTGPNWIPAEFPIHDDYYPLTGAHVPVASDCAMCHNGDYVNTPNTCVACHQNDYDESANPNHTTLGFPLDCASCHSTDPDWTPADYTEHNDFFPLDGAHASVSCDDCHMGNYINTPNTCVACHQTDYDQTTNPSHIDLSFPLDCASCHTTDPDWTPADYTEHNDFFPLDGAHASVSCNDCHMGNYINTPNTCVGCHQGDYDQTNNPDHTELGIPTDCASCHTTDPGWTPADFLIHDDYYPLTGAHTTISCNDCHMGNYENTPNTCVGCHQGDYDESINPDHSNLALSSDCLNCHTTNPDWIPADFPDHDSYYALTGAHIPIANDCALCHNGDYINTPNTCVGCHQSDYDASLNPDHGAIGIPTDCAMCHTADPNWIPADFPIHDDYYILTGAHVPIANQCALCHNGDYTNTPNTCAGCHTSDYNQTTNPDHAAIGIPTNCDMCHTTDPNWIPADFPIHDDYYPLTGAHVPVASDCALCHNGDYVNTPNTCVACHQSDYDASLNPDHDAIGIPTDCIMCHTTEPDWIPAEFPIHSDFYPLDGAHTSVSCNDCHMGNYVNTPNTCVACHQTDYDQTTDPDHTALGIPTDCASCHTTDPGWTPADFLIHDDYYPLTGAHTTVSCNDCHMGSYVNTPNTCVGCHQADYDESINPDHSNLGLSTDCLNCHTTNPDWMPADFPDHDSYYTLTGAHIPIASDCALCHNGDYINTPNTCVGCHQSDYDASLNPDHGAIGIPTDCAMCHTTDPNWIPADFPIHDDYYVLTGAHVPIADQCALCHNGDYTNTPNNCAGCHTSDYNQTINPDHAAIGIPTNCDLCHTTDPNWIPAGFPIHDDYYPLTGAHVPVASDCALCHNGDYVNTPNTCVACHQTDYDTSLNPDHDAIGIPTDCAMCHTTDPDWNPAEFPIHNDYYPLNGAHTTVDCASCHNGNYINTPNTCFGCHESDYNQTTNPDHSAAGFPTDCTNCHDETAWIPSSWDHDDAYFPIFSGKHDGEWDSCVDCHTDPNDYTVFDCLGCHGQTETDVVHTDVTGYIYESTACYACHPDGTD